MQGFGQVGSWAARIAAEQGCTVIAVSDVDGGTFNSQGLDVEALVKLKDEGGSVQNFKGGESISNNDLLELDCDILIPAAIDRVIHADNAPRVKAKVIIEAANHPLTPEADDILNDRGIRIVPDILVNAGGVVVSYFEWTQNLYQHTWDMDRVNDELSKIMTRAFTSVKDRVQAEGVTYREAAFLIGLERVAHVAELRGFI